MGHRARRLVLLTIFGLLVTHGFARPAQADWGSVLGDAQAPCNGATGHCPAPQDVCQYWGNYYGFWYGDLVPAYNGNYGQATNYICHVQYAQIEELTVAVYPFCTAWVTYPDLLSPSGCSPIPFPPAKQLGCSCSTSGNNGNHAMVGNPINVVIGNKVESVVDYESAGPQKLSFTLFVPRLWLAIEFRPRRPCSTATRRPARLG
jgi:hypothetical protein